MNDYEPNVSAAQQGAGSGQGLGSSEFRRVNRRRLQPELAHAGAGIDSSNKRPVFVVGCPRSGTTLLYHTILSSGNFAVFPLESNTFNVLGHKFSNLNTLKSRKKLIEYFVRSHNFAVMGLERNAIEPRILSECQNIGDFLRVVMEELCRKQGAPRWVEKTPDHVLYLPQIKQMIPDALFLHIIRDGRDAALSLANFGRIRPFFRETAPSLIGFGLYWKWMVNKGRAAGQKMGTDYFELHYEDLVERPRETLARVGNFIGCNLDYDRILEAGIGSVKQPETSFPHETNGQRAITENNSADKHPFRPVGRWKKYYSAEELSQFDVLVGDCLEEFGYALASGALSRRMSCGDKIASAICLFQLELKHWLKETPLYNLVK